MRRQLLALILAAGLIGGVAAQPAEAATVVKGVLTSHGYRWKPNAVSISRGGKVVWKAVNSNHTVTAYGGGWSKDTTINQGQSTSKTFRTAGVYKFRCRFHSTLVNGVCSGMCGKVTVG
jgi:plastocyanin